MEIYKAAEQYKQHLETLNKNTPAIDDVWVVYPRGDGYVLMLTSSAYEGPKCPENPAKNADAWEEYEEARYITKQRGGLRIFKSLEAVVNALSQIGQPQMTIDVPEFEG